MSRAILHISIMSFYFRFLSSYWVWLADTTCSIPCVLHARCMADTEIWQIVVMLIKLLTMRYQISMARMTTVFESGYALAFRFPASASSMVLPIHADAGITTRGSTNDALLPVGSSWSMRVRMAHMT
jgi:hypothetical protein